MKSVLVLLAASVAATAGEYAVLKTGFRLHAESHIIDGKLLKLQTKAGPIELPVDAVEAFEQEEYVTPPPVPPSPVAAVVAAPTPAVKKTPRELVTEAALRAGLPPALVHSIAKAESAYNVNAVSVKGAIGIMQLMPGTAAALDADPNDPTQNVEAGTRYLRDLLMKYEGDPHQVTKAIAAYNAGPGAVDKYKGIPPYRETIQYVNRVVREYEKNQIQDQNPAPKKSGPTD